MKILILGAKGMLGQYLAETFSGHEVLAWDREELDITSEQATNGKIQETRPEIIINAAAYNAVDKAEDEEELATLINGKAVGYIAETASKLGALFVHYSTDYVFDGEKQEGYSEDYTPNPVSAYGRSKLAGERELLLRAKSRSTSQNEFSTLRQAQGLSGEHSRITDSNNTNFPYYLIRTSRLFGKAGGGKQSFVDAILERAKIENTLEVVDEEVSSPTYAKDLAKRTAEIINTRRPFGIYHIANVGACTWFAFAQEILRLAKNVGMLENIPELRPVAASTFGRPAKRPAYSVLVNTKLGSMRSWQEALKEYVGDSL